MDGDDIPERVSLLFARPASVWGSLTGGHRDVGEFLQLPVRAGAMREGGHDQGDADLCMQGGVRSGRTPPCRHQDMRSIFGASGVTEGFWLRRCRVVTQHLWSPPMMILQRTASSAESRVCWRSRSALGPTPWRVARWSRPTRRRSFTSCKPASWSARVAGAPMSGSGRGSMSPSLRTARPSWYSVARTSTRGAKWIVPSSTSGRVEVLHLLPIPPGRREASCGRMACSAVEAFPRRRALSGPAIRSSFGHTARRWSARHHL